MNKITFLLKFKLLLIFCFISQISLAQCPTEDISYLTQAEVNQFIIDYPNCTELNVNVTIGNDTYPFETTDITSLQSFENLTKINGDLSITATSLVDLQ